MTVKIMDLETLQMGVQGTRNGTAVSATNVVDFESAQLKIDRKKIRVRRSGSMATSHRSDNGLVDYELTVKTVGTYDRIVTFLPSFLAPTITGTGASADKTWAFLPADASDNLKALTFECGGVDSWPTSFLLGGCIGKSMTIEMTQEGLWNCTWVFIPQTKTNGSLTGSLSAASSLVDILGYSTKVYIDTTTIHTTQPGQMISAKLQVDLGTIPLHYLGSTTGEAGDVQQTKRRTVKLDVIGAWAATTEFAAWEANTLRKISLDSLGGALGDTAYEARFDFYGTTETWELGSRDGEVTQQLSLEGQYDATATADVRASVVNSIASIP